MNNKILWLRVSYWAGAIADVLVAILSLIPKRIGEIEYRYPMKLVSRTYFLHKADGYNNYLYDYN